MIAIIALTAGCSDANKGNSPGAEADPTVYGGGDTNSKAAIETDVAPALPEPAAKQQ